MYLIFKLFYLYTPLNLLCKEMRCLNKKIIIIIIIINLIAKMYTYVCGHSSQRQLWD